MAMILHIETTTHVCSVALTRDGQLLNERENKEGRSHASLLSYFIWQISDEEQIAPADFDAVSISEGPGSYTGLRIGVSTAKGLCYGADIPLIAVNTLQSLTQGFFYRIKEKKKNPERNAIYIPMLDARRMEVYLHLTPKSTLTIMLCIAMLIFWRCVISMKKKRRKSKLLNLI